MAALKSFFLFQKGDGRGLTAGRRRFLFWLWNGGMLLLAALGITAVRLLLAVGDYRLLIFVGYFRHPLIFLLNFLPVAALMLLGWVVTGRSWAAYLFGALPALTLAFGNYYKMVFRNDPVLFDDLLFLSEAGFMADKYHLFLNGRLALVLACAVGGFLVLFFLVRGRPRGRVRLIALAALALGVLLGWKPYLSSAAYQNTGTNLEYLSRWASTHQYISRGNLYPFLYSAKTAIRTPPEGYNEREIADLLNQYQDADIPEDQKVNIVGIMLEAFSDLSGIDGVEPTELVYEIYHGLQAESYTGRLVTNIFAGGTVDTERAFLTGLGTQYNWRSNVNSYVWYFRQQGYQTSGDHPSFQWFYNRENVNQYLGFVEYRFVEDYYTRFTNGQVAMDQIFFPQLTESVLEKLGTGQPLFSFSVSYQGHGPYSSGGCGWGDVDNYVKNENLDEASRNILANYFGSVRNTQKHLQAMVERFRQSEEPIVLVVFGDHKPWLGNANSVYEALGVNLNLSSEEGFYNYWSTEYLIWANDAAKAKLGFDFTGEGPDLSPCFLMTHLFDLLGWKGDAYNQAITPIYQTLPVLHQTGTCLENGTLHSREELEDPELYQCYRLLEYYRATRFTGQK